jgi:hypothetical protein
MLIKIKRLKLMALRIKDGRVISIIPPKTLSKKQLEKMENAPKNEKLIKEATSIKFNIVYR